MSASIDISRLASHHGLRVTSVSQPDDCSDGDITFDNHTSIQFDDQLIPLAVVVERRDGHHGFIFHPFLDRSQPFLSAVRMCASLGWK